MDEKTTDQKIKPEWLKDYTIVAILGIVFIVLFWVFTTIFNLP